MSEVPEYYIRKYILYVGIACVLGVFFFVKWANSTYSLEKQQTEIALRFKSFKVYEEPYYIPDVEFLNERGEAVKFSDYHGKYIVLNFWATWCPACVKELPSLKRLSKILEADEKWKVMAVSIDQKQNLDMVSKFTEKYSVTDIASYYDYKNAFQNNLNIKAMPTTYIVSSTGRVLYEITGGGIWHEAKIIKWLDLVKDVY